MGFGNVKVRGRKWLNKYAVVFFGFSIQLCDNNLFFITSYGSADFRFLR